MTIASTSLIPEKYAGNNTAKEFSFPFRVFAPSDVVVIQADDTGAETTLIAGQDYTVTLDSSGIGGVVTLFSALPSGFILSISRSTPINQETDLVNQGAFFAEDHETAFDKLTAICQEMSEVLGRCLIVPITGEMTREEMLANLLEVAAKANEYAKKAEEVLKETQKTQVEVNDARDTAVDASNTATDAANQATQMADQVSADKAVAQELLSQAKEISTDASEIADEAIKAAESAINAKEAAVEASNSAGFSYRYCASIEANGTGYLGVLVPNTNAKVGDHVLNDDGLFFEIVSLTEEQFTVGEVVTTLKGEKGDTGQALEISEAFETEEDLIASIPKGKAGQCVLVGSTIYTWSEKNQAWIASEILQGPAGPAGQSANEILMDPDPVKFFDEIYGKTDLVTGDLIVDVSGVDPDPSTTFEEALEDENADTGESADSLTDIFDETLGS